MKGIFISYRRDDAAGYAGRLYDRLAGHFGPDRVFMDVEGIEPGVDFVDAIERAVGSCEVLIVIIGKDWLAVDGAGKRRLDDPADFVRIETASALARNIRVVPVLVDEAEMPRVDQLPKELALLARRQAVELSHKQWDATSSELIQTLEKILNAGKRSSAEAPPPASAPIASQREARSEAASAASVSGASGNRRNWVIGAVLAVLVAAGALFLTQPWNKFEAPAQRPGQLAVAPEKPPDAAPARPVVPTAVSPEPKPTAPTEKSPDPAPVLPVVPPEPKPAAPAEKTPEPAPARPAAAPEPKPAAPGLPPKILHFETGGTPSNVLLCYGVQNAASATITPSPGNVKPVAKECVPGAAGRYTLTARNAAGVAVSKTLTVEAAPSPPPVQTVTVPNAIGKARGDALAELEKAGLQVRIVEDKLDPKASGPADSVVAQLPKAGEQIKAGGRVTLQVMPAAVPTPGPTAMPTPVPASVATAPSALPRVGDVWEYRFRSIWKNVEPRVYTHQVTAVSEREVRETMSTTSGADKTSESKTLTPDTRFVEWRGRGYYFIEFNPFAQAFGALQPGTAWKLSIPAEDSFFGNWYTQGRALNWDSVTVPAGTFKAVRVEINSNRPATGSQAMWGKEPVRILQVIWYAPDAKRTVKLVRTVFSASGGRLDEDTYELTKYRLQ